MFWYALPILAVGAIGAWLFNSVSESEKQAEMSWQKKRIEVEKTLVEHQKNIEKHISQARDSYDFHFLVDMHYSSVKVADSAYKLLSDARESLNGLGKMIVNTKQRKLELEKELENAKKDKNKNEIHRIVEELKMINELRRELFFQKEILISQKNSFYNEVKRLNNQTSNLKHFIRQRCGGRGIQWYNKLEARKLLR